MVCLASDSAAGSPARSLRIKRDVSRFGRDVGARSHRDADVRSRQRRRVVQSVANHRDAEAFGLEMRDSVNLAVWKHLGDHATNAGLARNGFGRLASIACQHDARDAERPQASR